MGSQIRSYHHSLNNPFLLLILVIFFFSTTSLITAAGSAASTSFVSSPSLRLSIRPPKWLVRRDDQSASAAAASNKSSVVYTLHEYNQTIDHFIFRPESYLKFKQRYLIKTDYWGGAKSNSPIFVYLGAEESVLDEAFGIGLLIENAPHFKAMIVFIEHRFYGESIPYGWKIEEAIKHFEIRGCLSISQVLADYAEVISFLKHKYSADLSPVVVFGGSYGGMLATWFRLKYPHITMGALASSAPVLDHVRDGNKYYDRVAKDYWVFTDFNLFSELKPVTNLGVLMRSAKNWLAHSIFPQNKCGGPGQGFSLFKPGLGQNK